MNQRGPRVSVINWPRRPISPREGMLNSMRTRPELCSPFFSFHRAGFQRFHHDADERFWTIDDQEFQRFQAAPVFGAHHDSGLAHHQLVALAAHGLDQDGQLQLAGPSTRNASVVLVSSTRSETW